MASTLLARGTADELNIRARSTGVKLVAGRPTDVALVRATIVAGGETGWQAHPGPSFIIVTSGALTTRAAHRRHCMDRGFAAGDVFAHPDGVHNFIAGAEGVEFYVSCFVPAGTTPLLTPASPPAGARGRAAAPVVRSMAPTVG